MHSFNRLYKMNDKDHAVKLEILRLEIIIIKHNIRKLAVTNSIAIVGICFAIGYLAFKVSA